MENFDIDVPNIRLFDLTFGYTSADEITALSVKEMTNPQTFDSLLHPTIGGLHDPALGPSDRDDMCFTCGMNNYHCPGHFGHISLPLPVFNPVFFKTFYQILKGSCFSCHRLRSPPLPATLLLHQLELLRHGLLHQVFELQQQVFQLKEQMGSTPNAVDNIQEEIHVYTEKCIAEGSPDCSVVKNIAEIRRLLVKDFLASYLTGSGKCPHCQMPVQTLRQENNCKLCLYHTKDKRQILKALEAREKMMLKRRQEALRVEDAEEVLLEEEAQNATNIEKTASSGQTYLTPLEARSHLRRVWEKDGGILRALFRAMSAGHGATECSTDIFFLDVVPVPPTRFRPISLMHGKKFENPQTANLARVLADCAIIKHILGAIDNESKAKEPVPPCDQTEKVSLDTTPGKTLTEKLQNAWVRLQMHTNCVVDSDLDRISTDKHPGIKQLLEKKEGLFRKHMMGKRVNFAARSVISPDPCIDTCEIGLPQVFATKLTFPQPVTPWNVHELRQAVINGPEVHPGAVFVMNEDGSKVMLTAGNKSQREAIAKQLLTPSSYNKSQLGVKKVFRHIKNGDMMLMNRQPTLHRPSIQAHRVHVLPGEKTLRLHYANCKAYNADFDGDEMNAHFPQSELGRAEAVNIACTDFNYLVPKDGTPLAGLLQDHMISGVWLTIRGRFFHRDDYYQLVYTGMTDVSGPVKLLPPAIRRPQVLWSGKQVLSTLLLNVIPEGKSPLNLIGKAKIPEKSWKNAMSRQLPLSYSEEEMGESYVVIRSGELLCGVLDKGHYGPTPYGLVHSCFELYGGSIAGKLLTCLAKLFTSFLQMCRGFTLGVEDILCVPRAEKKRRLVMIEAENLGRIAGAKAVNLAENASVEKIAAKLQSAQHDKNSTGIQDWDLCMKSVTDDVQNRIAKVCLPLGLEKVFPENNLQLMVQSGAKGSTVNTMQISCLLGQIELEGRRPPLMLSGKFLPSFRPYDTAPRAGGFIDGRFLTGIRPQEYFHHCMAGREGLVDTAVKTSRSGYLQRCLIKHLEGIMVNYDMTVRDSDGSIIQFHYGEDGMDVCKTAFLNTKLFPFLIDNVEVEASNLDLNRSLSKTVRKRHSKIKRWKNKNFQRLQSKVRLSGFLKFCRSHASEITDDSDSSVALYGRTNAADTLCKKWRILTDEQRQKFMKGCVSCPDPVMSSFRQFQSGGILPEKFVEMLDSYCKNNPDRLLHSNDTEVHDRHQISEDFFRQLISSKYMKSLSEPGDAVGLLMAQSIGEPSTQMTLNTFHFAGRGEMNVTLGIPRLREILMVASAHIKTPSMDVPIFDTDRAVASVKKLQKSLAKVTLAQVLQEVKVVESLSVLNKQDRSRLFHVRFTFLPEACYQHDFVVTPTSVLQFMEKVYLRHLIVVITKKIQELRNSSVLSSGSVRQTNTASDVNESVDTSRPPDPDEETNVTDDEANDGDSTATRHVSRQEDAHDYEGEEEEVEDLVRDGVEDVGDSQEVENVIEDAEEMEEEIEEEADDNPTDSEQKKGRVNTVLQLSPKIVAYKYDNRRHRWLEVTLKFGIENSKMDLISIIEADARRTIVHQVPGISKAFISEEKAPNGEKVKHLKTEGVNMEEIYKHQDIVDISRLYSNDIHAMAKRYGIEAAARVIVKEVSSVFGAYGIGVDYRHLSLLSDYMTFEGSYKPFNRLAMESNPSPLQQMSFETTMHFLVDSSIQGRKDPLQSPSARIVTGRVVSSGTGCFELRQPLF